MSRYEKGHKEKTRNLIISSASEQFRKEGVDGVGIASLMDRAGLTVGGFYAHFESKEALVREAISHAMDGGSPFSRRLLTSKSRSDLEESIDMYLSAGHRDNPAKGCAIAALAADTVRRPRASRNAVAKRVQCLIEQLAEALPQEVAHHERRGRALAIYAHLLGTLQLARILPEKTVSDAVLEAGRIHAKTLIGMGEISSGREVGRASGADHLSFVGRPPVQTV